MKKQLIRISILQSSTTITVLYTFMGFVHLFIGIPLLTFGDTQLRRPGGGMRFKLGFFRATA
ncbi:MAG: hypothetical protein HZC54_03210 [Verrucomicrobia bacterium]|nr:hypothetical protein [Verrucomicrobiota bacterium]